VREGELEVTHAQGFVETIDSGHFLGEETILRTARSRWEARTTRESEIAWIPAHEIRRLPAVMWKLLEAHDRRRSAITNAPRPRSG
jgi:hypothetical protein